MDPLAVRVAARFLRLAGVLHWTPRKEERDDYTTEYEDASAPNGWRYEIRHFISHQYGPSATWTVEVFLGPNDRYGKYLTKDGVEQRMGKRTDLPSLEVAKLAAEKHYALATAPKETDPKKLVHMLTPAQKDIILEAYDNGGHLEPDWGTKSERPLRQHRTKMYKQLGPIGIFKNEQYLSEFGIEIAKLLKGHA